MQYTCITSLWCCLLFVLLYLHVPVLAGGKPKSKYLGHISFPTNQADYVEGGHFYETYVENNVVQGSTLHVTEVEGANMKYTNTFYSNFDSLDICNLNNPFDNNFQFVAQRTDDYVYFFPMKEHQKTFDERQENEQQRKMDSFKKWMPIRKIQSLFAFGHSCPVDNTVQIGQTDFTSRICMGRAPHNYRNFEKISKSVLLHQSQKLYVFNFLTTNERNIDVWRNGYEVTDERNPLRKNQVHNILFATRDHFEPLEQFLVQSTLAAFDAIAKGHSIYIHCWGGHGRTGASVVVLLSSLLLLSDKQHTITGMSKTFSKNNFQIKLGSDTLNSAVEAFTVRQAGTNIQDIREKIQIVLFAVNLWLNTGGAVTPKGKKWNIREYVYVQKNALWATKYILDHRVDIQERITACVTRDGGSFDFVRQMGSKIADLISCHSFDKVLGLKIPFYKQMVVNKDVFKTRHAYLVLK